MQLAAQGDWNMPEGLPEAPPGTDADAPSGSGSGGKKKSMVLVAITKFMHNLQQTQHHLAEVAHEEHHGKKKLAHEEHGVSTKEYLNDGNHEHYTEDAIAARAALRVHSEVVEWLERFWTTFVTVKTGGAELKREEVLSVSVKMCKALFGPEEWDWAEAAEAAEADWEREIGVGKAMTCTAFYDSLFEIADVWTVDIDVHEYTNFLAALYYRITCAVRKRGANDKWRKTRERMWAATENIDSLKLVGSCHDDSDAAANARGSPPKGERPGLARSGSSSVGRLLQQGLDRATSILPDLETEHKRAREPLANKPSMKRLGTSRWKKGLNTLLAVNVIASAGVQKLMHDKCNPQKMPAWKQLAERFLRPTDDEDESDDNVSGASARGDGARGNGARSGVGNEMHGADQRDGNHWRSSDGANSSLGGSGNEGAGDGGLQGRERRGSHWRPSSTTEDRQGGAAYESNAAEDSIAERDAAHGNHWMPSSGGTSALSSHPVYDSGGVRDDGVRGETGANQWRPSGATNLRPSGSGYDGPGVDDNVREVRGESGKLHWQAGGAPSAPKLPSSLSQQQYTPHDDAASVAVRGGVWRVGKSASDGANPYDEEKYSDRIIDVARTGASDDGPTWKAVGGGVAPSLMVSSYDSCDDDADGDHRLRRRTSNPNPMAGLGARQRRSSDGAGADSFQLPDINSSTDASSAAPGPREKWKLTNNAPKCLGLGVPADKYLDKDPYDCGNAQPKRDERGPFIAGSISDDRTKEAPPLAPLSPQPSPKRDIRFANFPDESARPRKRVETTLAQKKTVRLLQRALKQTAQRFGGGGDLLGLFNMLDRDNSGAIDADELHVGIRSTLKLSNTQLTDSHIADLLSAIDTDMSGAIEFEELVAFVDGVDGSKTFGRRGVNGQQRVVSVKKAASSHVLVDAQASIVTSSINRRARSNSAPEVISSSQRRAIPIGPQGKACLEEGGPSSSFQAQLEMHAPAVAKFGAAGGADMIAAIAQTQHQVHSFGSRRRSSSNDASIAAIAHTQQQVHSSGSRRRSASNAAQLGSLQG